MRALLACGMLLVALPATAAAQQCWYDLGVKQHGNTTALRAELQQLVEQGHCKILGIVWRLETTREHPTMLLWDEDAAMLWRIHVQRETAGWEGWPSSTKEAVLAPSYVGVVSHGIMSGNGHVPVSEPARQFGRQHGGAAFAVAF